MKDKEGGNAVKGKKGFQKKPIEKVRGEAILFRLTKDEKRKLNEYVQRHGFVRSTWIRELVKREITKEGE